ncbi:MAG: DUF721 domain-containing protein [Planctomycetales bacterium]|nr:DUF721 domain-containing protein [Planctomycetales bacterium]
MQEPSNEEREQWDLAQIKQRPSRYQPKTMGACVKRLMARKGYGEIRSAGELEETWQNLLGDSLAQHCHMGNITRGVLTVYVSDSAISQELSMRKSQILRELQKSYTAGTVKDLRIRIQS